MQFVSFANDSVIASHFWSSMVEVIESKTLDKIVTADGMGITNNVHGYGQSGSVASARCKEPQIYALECVWA